MPQNLSLKTGKFNIQNVSEFANKPIILSGTTPSTAPITSLSINLNSITSSVFIGGITTFVIADSAAGNQLGPLFLQITRPVNGKETVIYETEYQIKNMDYLADSVVVDHFGFEWLDINPASSLCPDTCTTSSDTCPDTTITYSFNIYTPGLINTTQNLQIGRDDIYSYTLIEVNTNNQ